MAIRLSVAVVCALLAVWAAIGQNREPGRRTPAAAEWTMYGRDAAETHDSPLDQLVFYGLTGGRFFAYRAETGAKLWEVQLPLGMATPVTWALDGSAAVNGVE